MIKAGRLTKNKSNFKNLDVNFCFIGEKYLKLWNDTIKRY